MEKINQKDEFGGRQGLWVHYYYRTDIIGTKANYLDDKLHGEYIEYSGKGNIENKRFFFKNELINYFFDNSMNGLFYADRFFHQIF